MPLASLLYVRFLMANQWHSQIVGQPIIRTATTTWSFIQTRIQEFHSSPSIYTPRWSSNTSLDAAWITHHFIPSCILEVILQGSTQLAHSKTQGCHQCYWIIPSWFPSIARTLPLTQLCLAQLCATQIDRSLRSLQQQLSHQTHWFEAVSSTSLASHLSANIPQSTNIPQQFPHSIHIPQSSVFPATASNIWWNYSSDNPQTQANVPAADWTGLQHNQKQHYNNAPSQRKYYVPGGRPSSSCPWISSGRRRAITWNYLWYTVDFKWNHFTNHRHQDSEPQDKQLNHCYIFQQPTHSKTQQ